MDSEEIVVKCKSGGSVVGRAPVFSPDGSYMYVPWTNSLRCFSTVTGEKVADFEETSSNIVSTHMHPFNSKFLLTCSVMGELTFWDWKTQLPFLKRSIKGNVESVRSFHVLMTGRSETDDCEVLITWGGSSSAAPGHHKMGVFGASDGTLKRTIPVKLAGGTADLIDVGCGSSSDRQFVVVASGNRVQWTDLSQVKVQRQSIGGGRKLTCLACHPEQQCFATGDSSGRIVVWRGLFGKKNGTSAQAVHHWHTLPVRALTFSRAGSDLYSGGEECVVVRWRLDDSQHRDFLPRLGAPVERLTVAPDNLLLAVATADNALHLVDPQLKVRRVIQQTVRPAAAGTSCRAGLHAHSVSRTLVWNGRPGQLQMYVPSAEALACSLDVVAQNLLSRERETGLANTDIVLLAVAPSGHWFATVEERRSVISVAGERSAVEESRLKFWSCGEHGSTRRFRLSASVEWPHEGGVLSLDWRPGPLNACATAGSVDGHFRCWQLGNGDDTSWRCTSVGQHRGLDAGPLAHSADGSLLAVGFRSRLTVWSPDTCALRCSLTHPGCGRPEDPLRHLVFGRADRAHLVLTASERRLSAWDLLTLSLTWTVATDVSGLCADPLSAYVASVCVEADGSNTLRILTPCSPMPVYTKRDLVVGGAATVTALAFMPRDTERPGAPGWLRRSALYLLDGEGQLLQVDTATGGAGVENGAVETGAWSPRSLTMSAERGASVTENGTGSSIGNAGRLHRGLASSLDVTELVRPPVHTMAPMRFLCGPVLRSLVLVDRSTGSKEQLQDHDDDDDVDDDGGKGDGSDEEPASLPHSERRPLPEKRLAAHRQQHHQQHQDRDMSHLRKLLMQQVSWPTILAE